MKISQKCHFREYQTLEKYEISASQPHSLPRVTRFVDPPQSVGVMELW